MKKTILSMLALSAIVISCNKDDDKSTSELLLGKWNVITVYENRYYSNLDHRDTSTYAPGVETLEFTNNGTVYMAGVFSNGVTYKDTGVYKLDGSNVILDYTDTFKINSISASDMQWYNKSFYNSGTAYDEMTVDLKK